MTLQQQVQQHLQNTGISLRELSRRSGISHQKEVRLQEQLTEVYATKTRQEAQIMRLRMYVWSLIAALALVVASGLVVWGGA